MANPKMQITLKPEVLAALKAEAEAVGVGTSTLAAVILGQHLSNTKALLGSLGTTMQELAEKERKGCDD